MIYSDFRYFHQRANFISDSNNSQNQFNFYSLRLQYRDFKILSDEPYAQNEKSENIESQKLF